MEDYYFDDKDVNYWSKKQQRTKLFMINNNDIDSYT